jgi:hypothetical protein
VKQVHSQIQLWHGLSDIVLGRFAINLTEWNTPYSTGIEHFRNVPIEVPFLEIRVGDTASYGLRLNQHSSWSTCGAWGGVRDDMVNC